jgi:stage V sporulation protein B
MQKQSFIRGTFTLTAAGLVTRMIGFANGIVLSRLLGAEGIGLLMMAYPLIPLIVTLTELGLPVAISKLVAEAEAGNNERKIKRILTVSLTVTGTLSIVLTLISLLGAKAIAGILLTDQRAYYAMLALIPIAPIVAVSAVLKGYFRGRQNMKSIALSDIIEQSVHVTGVMVLIQLLLPYGLPYAAAGAMAGAVLGEAAGLTFLLTRFRIQRRREGAQTEGEGLFGRLREGKQTLFELLHLGLPTSGNGFIHSIYSAFQPMLVTKSLAVAGLTTQAATKQFGMLAGYVFPLLFLPSFITHSLTTALIPAISEARAGKDKLLLHRRIDQAMEISVVVAFPSTCLLFLFATPLTTLIYHAPEAGPLLRLLAPIFFFDYFDGPLYAILLGLGRAASAMWNFIIATSLKAVAIMVLGTKFGIEGVAVGIGIGVTLVAMLHFLSVSSVIGSYVDMRRIAKVAISTAVMALCGQFANSLLQHAGLGLIWQVAGAIGGSVLIYIAMLRVIGLRGGRSTARLPL